MADGTKIEWTDATANYVNGCTVVSPGCTNCYAMRLAGTRMKHHPTREGLTVDTKAGPVWTGEVRAHEPVLKTVLGWRRPRRIFWNAHGDLFHEAVPVEWIDRAFAVMAMTPHHQHQVLTKRPDRMRGYLTQDRSLAICKQMDTLSEPTAASLEGVKALAERMPLPNVWLGTSVEDQTRADERIKHLLATPAAKRFLSCEPLLGEVDIFLEPGSTTGLHWVIVGGESGPGARPMHPNWVRTLRDQCEGAGIPFFFKQWGDWAPCSIGADGDLNPPMPLGNDIMGWMRWEQDHYRRPIKGEKVDTWFAPGLLAVPVGKRTAGNSLDGRTHMEFPA